MDVQMIPRNNLKMLQTTEALTARLLLIALVSLFAIPNTALFAQEAATPNTDVKPGDVNLDLSRVYTFVDKTGLGHQHAIEGKLSSGRLMLGAGSEAGQLLFDMRSFDADTVAARRYLGLEGTTAESTRSQVTANMKADSVLDVARYPTATFDVDSAKATNQTSQEGRPIYELVGRFTLHGKQQPLTVKADVEQARGWLHVRGSFAIKQTSFGIRPYTKAFGAIGVSDALRIHGDLWVAPNTHVSMTNIPERK
jgi:hypothetical protein